MARCSCGMAYASSVVFTSFIAGLFVSETAIGESTSGGTHATVNYAGQRRAKIADDSGMVTVSDGVDRASGITREATTFSQDSIPSTNPSRRNGPWSACSYRRRVDAFANIYSFPSFSRPHRKRPPNSSPSQGVPPRGRSRSWWATLQERGFDVDERVASGILSVVTFSGCLRVVRRSRLGWFSWCTNRRTELTLHSSTDAAEKAVGDLLREKLLMSNKEVQSVATRCSALRTEAGVAVAREVVAFFCGGGLDLRVDQMRMLALRDPRILELSVERKLAPQAHNWLERSDLGLTRFKLGKMVLDCPENLDAKAEQVFLLDYDKVLARIVLWLLVEVRLPRDRVSNTLLSYPSLLAADLDNELRPRLRWMTDRLGLDDKDVRRMLALSPEALIASFDDTLLPACDWLKGVMECDIAGVGHVLSKAPELFTAEPSVLEKKLIDMSSTLFEGEREPAVAAFIAQPLLLVRSDRLGPLVGVMVGALGASLSEAREVMTTDPSILEFQMERRVRPRLEAIMKAGMGASNLESEGNSEIDGRKQGVLSLEEKLKVLGKFSDARFEKWLGRRSIRTSPRNDVDFLRTA